MTEQETAKMGCFGFLKVTMFVFNGIICVSSCDFLFYALWVLCAPKFRDMQNCVRWQSVWNTCEYKLFSIEYLVCNRHVSTTKWRPFPGVVHTRHEVAHMPRRLAAYTMHLSFWCLLYFVREPWAICIWTGCDSKKNEKVQVICKIKYFAK